MAKINIEPSRSSSRAGKSDGPSMRVPRFRLRTMLVLIAVMAILFGLYASLERERARSEKAIARVTDQLRIAKGEIGNADSRAEMKAHLYGRDLLIHQRTLEGPYFGQANLRGLVIEGGVSAFQKTVFDDSDLSDACLTGGGASFQGASFKNAILKRAKIVGGGSSLQLAMFENADLTGARLEGNLAGVLLKNANCTAATIKGLFHGANIDATQFEDADLTGIKSQDLGSCFFVTPPRYNVNTKFPEGFDPNDHGWQKHLISKYN